MGNFNISQSSGVGPATIKVNPTSENDKEEIREQVLRITVHNVTRDVTLIQGAHPPIIEAWVPYFSISPESQTSKFNGDKSGETLEIAVTSYQQQTLDDVPQEVYQAIPWEVTNTADWLEVTTEVGQDNSPGKIVVKTTSVNKEYSGTDTIDRSSTLTITQEGGSTKTLTITQSKGTPLFSFNLSGNGTNIGGIQVFESSKNVSLKATLSKKIGGTVLGTYPAYVKIPTLNNKVSFSGTADIGSGTVATYQGEGWVINPGSIVDTYQDTFTLNCAFKAKDGTTKFDEMIQKITEAYPKWKLELDSSRLPSGATISNIANFDKNTSFYFFT